MAKTNQPELEYIIVSESSKLLLQERVNYYIGVGYVPAGGVAVQVGHNVYGEITFDFHQAMVRKTE